MTDKKYTDPEYAEQLGYMVGRQIAPQKIKKILKVEGTPLDDPFDDETPQEPAKE